MKWILETAVTMYFRQEFEADTPEEANTMAKSLIAEPPFGEHVDDDRTFTLTPKKEDEDECSNL